MLWFHEDWEGQPDGISQRTFFGLRSGEIMICLAWDWAELRKFNCLIFLLFFKAYWIECDSSMENTCFTWFLGFDPIGHHKPRHCHAWKNGSSKSSSNQFLANLCSFKSKQFPSHEILCVVPITVICLSVYVVSWDFCELLWVKEKKQLISSEWS